MAEQGADNPQKPLEPDLIIEKDKESGKPIVSLIRQGRVLEANPNSRVTETKDENGRLRIKVDTGRIIRK